MISMPEKIIQIGDSHPVRIGNHLPLVIIGGVNVLESRDLARQVAETFCEITERLKIPYIFKGSFDKANRSSLDSFRGPGLEEGLRILQDIKTEFRVPVLTDVHESHQAKPVSEVCDVLQIPAFLVRQTDLVLAIASCGKPVNIKKAQFLSPAEMVNIVKKMNAANNDRLMLCERGTSFGYNNLVVDMLGFRTMKKTNYPVIFDVTHALQLPGGKGIAAGGRGDAVADLARAGISQGLAGLFLETHPEPAKAKCDGPCALPLEQLNRFLTDMHRLDTLIKNILGGNH